MPTYEYGCECGNKWEEIRAIAALDDPIICPECGLTGWRLWKQAPHVMWFPDQTRSPFKEKRRHH